MKRELVIVGGGPAGLAAATGAYDAGVRDILVLERETRLGGILNQCIHNGFGLHMFREELTGPEYAARFVREVQRRGIECKTDTTVIGLDRNRRITAVNAADGPMSIDAGAVILACGCRERPRGAINIAGSRVAGVYSAGTAQKLINIKGYMPGREVVILGSGDIGLIMARRMTFAGAKVKAVIELMPYSSGLKRNIAQCLDDFGIPLLLSHTVTEIRGRGRISSVVVAPVDEKLAPIYEKAVEMTCDCLLLSVGLLPENELARGAGVALSPVTGGAAVGEDLMTSVPGVFECGNVLHVHDLVDYASEESAIAGRRAAAFLSAGGGASSEKRVAVKTYGGVRYTVPQYFSAGGAAEPVSLRLRVDNVYRDVRVSVKAGGREVAGANRRVVAPGEMETLVLSSEAVAALKAADEITVGLDKRRAEA